MLMDDDEQDEILQLQREIDADYKKISPSTSDLVLIKLIRFIDLVKTYEKTHGKINGKRIVSYVYPYTKIWNNIRKKYKSNMFDTTSGPR